MKDIILRENDGSTLITASLVAIFAAQCARTEVIILDLCGDDAAYIVPTFSHCTVPLQLCHLAGWPIRLCGSPRR